MADMTTIRIDVEPRVISPKTGDRIRLVDAVENLINRAGQGVVKIEGQPLEQASAVGRLVAQFGSAILDGRSLTSSLIAALANETVVVVIGDFAPRVDLLLQLSGWDNDDSIDYLLAHHRPQCGAVMERVRRSEPIWRPTTGVGWRAALSTLAMHPEFSSLHQAIKFILDSRLISESEAEAENAAAHLLTLNSSGETPPRISSWFGSDAAFVNSMKLDFWIGCIRQKHVPSHFAMMELSRSLLSQLAIGLRERKVDYDFLKHPERYRSRFQSIAASILLQLEPSWRPEGLHWTNLRNANFAGAVWPKLNISGVKQVLMDFSKTSFEGADLREAKLAHLFLREAELLGANLEGAVLQECDLVDINLADANLQLAEICLCDASDAFLAYADLRSVILSTVNLQHADLKNTNLESALLKEVVLNECQFENANLNSAFFKHCTFKRTDLRKTSLDHARFHGCKMQECNLEEVEAQSVEFCGSDLECAWLTCSVFKNANFSRANLHQAALGDIDWEGANLYGSDLSGVSFHFGSTRSGLVDSPYPSHGTRTGFYTDEFFEQSFKAPEEIRSANLRGADLRHADLANSDFYLVDLRGAQIDEDARPHLRRCKAILG